MGNKYNSLPVRKRGQWLVTDFPGSRLPAWLPQVPAIRNHPDVLANKRIRISLGITPRAGQAQVRAAFDAALRSRYQPHLELTIEKGLDQVLEYKGQIGLSPATITCYRQVASLFKKLCDARGDYLLSDLGPETIMAFQVHLIADRKAKPGGVNARLGQLAVLLRHLHNQGLLPGYRAAWVSGCKLRTGATPGRVITAAERQVLFESEYGDIYRWAFLTGARIGVILQLKRFSMDREAGVIRYPPGKRGERLVQPITAEIKDFLAGHKTPGQRGYLFWRDKWGEPGRASIGRACADLRATLRASLLDAGCPEGHLPRVHDFRVTNATLLLEAGMPTIAVARFQGRRDLKVLERHYYKPDTAGMEVPRLHDECASAAC